MDEIIVKRAVSYSRINAKEGLEVRLRMEALSKLQRCLSQNDSSPRLSDLVKVVTDYIQGSEVNRNKVLLFCESLKDPAKPKATRSDNDQDFDFQALRRERERDRGEMFCLQRRMCSRQPISFDRITLDDEELNKIVEFIMTHKSDKPFPVVLDEIMQKHGMEPPTVYRNACMSRQAFQRVYRMDRGDSVTLKMVWQIIFGLHCTIEEADELLFSAGYARHGDYYDLALAYLIEHEVYNVELANAALEELGLDCFNLHEHKT